MTPRRYTWPAWHNTLAFARAAQLQLGTRDRYKNPHVVGVCNVLQSNTTVIGHEGGMVHSLASAGADSATLETSDDNPRRTFSRSKLKSRAKRQRRGNAPQLPDALRTHCSKRLTMISNLTRRCGGQRTPKSTSVRPMTRASTTSSVDSLVQFATNGSIPPDVLPAGVSLRRTKAARRGEARRGEGTEGRRREERSNKRAYKESVYTYESHSL